MQSLRILRLVATLVVLTGSYASGQPKQYDKAEIEKTIEVVRDSKVEMWSRVFLAIDLAMNDEPKGVQILLEEFDTTLAQPKVFEKDDPDRYKDTIAEFFKLAPYVRDERLFAKMFGRLLHVDNSVVTRRGAAYRLATMIDGIDGPQMSPRTFDIVFGLLKSADANDNDEQVKTIALIAMLNGGRKFNKERYWLMLPRAPLMRMAQQADTEPNSMRVKAIDALGYVEPTDDEIIAILRDVIRNGKGLERVAATRAVFRIGVAAKKCRGDIEDMAKTAVNMEDRGVLGLMIAVTMDRINGNDERAVELLRQEARSPRKEVLAVVAEFSVVLK